MQTNLRTIRHQPASSVIKCLSYLALWNYFNTLGGVNFPLKTKKETSKILKMNETSSLLWKSLLIKTKKKKTKTTSFEMWKGESAAYKCGMRIVLQPLPIVSHHQTGCIKSSTTVARMCNWNSPNSTTHLLHQQHEMLIMISIHFLFHCSFFPSKKKFVQTRFCCCFPVFAAADLLAFVFFCFCLCFFSC